MAVMFKLIIFTRGLMTMMILSAVFKASTVYAHEGHHHGNKKYLSEAGFLTKEEANNFLDRDRRQLSRCITDEPFCEENKNVCNQESDREHVCVAHGTQCAAGQSCYLTVPCPAHFETGCTDIDECESNPCQNGATCTNGNNMYTCTCLPGYTGTNCEIDTNECESNPCQNGATCLDLVNQYTCTCDSGFSGYNCETDIDDCESDPCQNGATCADGVNMYTCTCLPGYSGTNCAIDTNECESNPCQNGATCQDHINQYTCTCDSGFSGHNCEADIDECESNPCQNGATCSNGVNMYTCTCSPGYADINCEKEINECESNPCKNSATCQDHINQYTCTCNLGFSGYNCETDIDECESNPCQNGATCTDGVNMYACTCLPGYTGTNCEIDINECHSNPCQNGAMCHDLVNQYTCTCILGFSGYNCETDIDECASNPCQNGATCSDGVNMYTCTCSPGYTGTNCEIDINECESNPCLNGATCDDLVNQYTCTCEEDFTGYNCEIDMCIPHFPEGVDIVFVMDASKSQCQGTFKSQKAYIQDFILDFPLGPNDTQISIVSFSLNVNVHFYLNEFTSHTDIDNIIDRINCSNSPSLIGDALSKLGDEVFQTANGARSSVSKFVIILTDGLFSDVQAAATQAAILRNSYPEIQLFAVGTGEQVLHTGLMSVASHYTKVFPVTNRDVVNSIVKSRVMSGCPDCFSRTSDIAIVMDSSVSLTNQQFYTQLNAVKTFLKVVPVSVSGIHVSYTKFGGEVEPEFHFNDHLSTNAVITAMSLPSRLTQMTGQSNVSKAFEHFRKHGFGTAQNARSDARKIVLLFTPASNVDISDKQEASLLKNEGVMIVTVGTGKDSNMSNLLSLASDPPLVYVVGDDVNIDLSSLYTLVGSLEHDVCELD